MLIPSAVLHHRTSHYGLIGSAPGGQDDKPYVSGSNPRGDTFLPLAVGVIDELPFSLWAGRLL